MSGLLSSRGVRALVEEQVGRWTTDKQGSRVGMQGPWPLIAISRQFGALGAAVGTKVAERMGFSFWDREIVTAIAKETGAREALLDSLDERSRNSIEEVLASMLMGEMTTMAEYVRQVVRIVGAVDKHGAGVIVGRGAQYILEEDRALRVRAVGPVDPRIEAYAKRQGLSHREAERKVVSMERDRQKFIRQHFNRDVTDPSDYDLAINTSTLSVDAAASVVIAAYRGKFGSLPEGVEI
ncbi:MAG: cytidylate kinase-like family protein [Deltaproteobacteria bacterium]|nr:cytidylate kinase-like family protein [Deltaproteobacteria bacterium]MBW2254209.1 cytidylate kinase-like family protein [Deltaproteobacteria bacterium]